MTTVVIWVLAVITFTLFVLAFRELLLARQRARKVFVQLEFEEIGCQIERDHLARFAEFFRTYVQAMAAIAFVVGKLELSTTRIENQRDQKTALFEQWDREP